MDSDPEDIEEFSGIEQPPLLEQIKRILDEYRNDVQIIKELIQNADDAEATSMKIMYEGKTINPEEEGESEYRQFLRAPALVFYNDAKFTEEDWRGIRSIYTSVKRDDPLKIGRFGLGFKSVFHLTDFPCIISGDNAMFINPHAKEFGKICVTVKLINLGKWKRLNYGDYQNSLMGTFGFSEQTLHEGRYEGTMFWFPLRQVASTLSDNVYPEDKVTHLLQAFLNESNRSLLFLKTLCSIHLHIDVQESSLEEIRTRDGSTRTLMQMSLGKDKDCFSVEVNNETSDLLNIRKDFLEELKEIGIDIPDHSKHWVFCINVKSVTNFLNESAKVAKARWLVVNYLKGGEISEKTKELMSDKELGYPHVVSVAAPIKEDGEYINTAGHVFCYQPLPQETASMTGLPVHINAFFALGQNRRQVRWPDAGDLTNGEGDKKIEWNIALRSEILPHAYVTLIEEMITLCKDGNCQEYLLKGVYNTIPNFSVVDEHWTDLAERVMELSKGSSILYTELNGGKWITVQQAVFTTFHSNPEYKEYRKTVYDLLIEDEINLVTVPQYVIEALQRVCHSLTEATPAFLRSHLEDNFRYKVLNRDPKMDLLEFVCLDTSRTHLENLELLPLQDGAFATFGQDKSVFKESKEVIELFPGKESSFVHGCCRQKTEKVLTELLEEGTGIFVHLSVFSPPKHEVLKVSYTDMWMSGVCRLSVSQQLVCVYKRGCIFHRIFIKVGQNVRLYEI